jgi:hypothetical protein
VGVETYTPENSQFFNKPLPTLYNVAAVAEAVGEGVENYSLWRVSLSMLDSPSSLEFKMRIIALGKLLVI